MNNEKQIEVAMIGKSIKALRKANNLTQEELASMCGYSPRNLRRIENYGTTSIEVINTFAMIFKVRAIDILNGCFILQLKSLQQFDCIASMLPYFIISLRSKQSRISSYTSYLNLFFIHMHFRLNYKGRPYNF